MPTLCRRPLLGLFFAMLLLLVPALSVGAAGPVRAPGALDTSFGTAGKQITAIDGIANAVAIQPDGRIVVAGAAGGDFLVARFLPNGAPDTEFGTSGVVRADFGGDETATALLLQPDGRILVGGNATTTGSNLLLARYLADGKPDPSFGTGGVVHSDYQGGTESLDDLALQPDGKIVLVGSTRSLQPFANILVARLHSDGSFDANFLGYGMRVDGISDTNYANMAAIQPDGNIVVAGLAASWGTAKVGGTLLIRYTAAGERDISFGDGGLIWKIQQGYPSYSGILILSDGKLIATGGTIAFGAFLDRYTPNGQPDASFGSTGRVYLESQQAQVIAAPTQSLGGSIVALGIRGLPDQTDFVVARFTPAGALDASFGNSGIVATGLSGTEVSRGLALQRDGKIVAVGSVGAKIALVRLLGDALLFVPIAGK